MKSYPSIPRNIKTGVFYAFDKLDGSNIRAEWSKKQGFYKFGTRKRLLDENDPSFGEAIPLFMERYGDILPEIAKANRWERAVFFCEFFGPSSIAGLHDPEEDKEVLLFDVNLHKKGLLRPEEFLKVFEGVEHAPLLHHGLIDEEFVTSVRESTLAGMSFEGVIVKGVPDKRGQGMFKIKSQAWLDVLKDRCGDNHKLFEKLK